MLFFLTGLSKVNRKPYAYHAPNENEGRGDKAPSTLNLGAAWKGVVSFRLQPLYSWGEIAVFSV